MGIMMLKVLVASLALLNCTTSAQSATGSTTSSTTVGAASSTSIGAGGTTTVWMARSTAGRNPQPNGNGNPGNFCSYVTCNGNRSIMNSLLQIQLMAKQTQSL